MYSQVCENGVEMKDFKILHPSFSYRLWTIFGRKRWVREWLTANKGSQHCITIIPEWTPQQILINHDCKLASNGARISSPLGVTGPFCFCIISDTFSSHFHLLTWFCFTYMSRLGHCHVRFETRFFLLCLLYSQVLAFGILFFHPPAKSTSNYLVTGFFYMLVLYLEQKLLVVCLGYRKDICNVCCCLTMKWKWALIT